MKRPGTVPRRADPLRTFRLLRRAVRPVGRRPRPVRARRKTVQPCQYRVVRAPREISKTFNNGSLGSGIDEERSEMR